MRGFSKPSLCNRPLDFHPLPFGFFQISPPQFGAGEFIGLE